MSPLNLTAKEAAALSRARDALVATNDESDPGMPDLRSVRNKVDRLPQDHSLYDAYFASHGLAR
jgi:hypothetical protein